MHKLQSLCTFPEKAHGRPLGPIFPAPAHEPDMAARIRHEEGQMAIRPCLLLGKAGRSQKRIVAGVDDAGRMADGCQKLLAGGLPPIVQSIPEPVQGSAPGRSDSGLPGTGGPFPRFSPATVRADNACISGTRAGPEPWPNPPDRRVRKGLPPRAPNPEPGPGPRQDI